MVIRDVHGLPIGPGVRGYRLCETCGCPTSQGFLSELDVVCSEPCLTSVAWTVEFGGAVVTVTNAVVEALVEAEAAGGPEAPIFWTEWECFEDDNGDYDPLGLSGVVVD